jgi:hypothetical protein
MRFGAVPGRHDDVPQVRPSARTSAFAFCAAAARSPIKSLPVIPSSFTNASALLDVRVTDPDMLIESLALGFEKL